MEVETEVPIKKSLSLVSFDSIHLSIKILERLLKVNIYVLALRSWVITTTNQFVQEKRKLGKMIFKVYSLNLKSFIKVWIYFKRHELDENTVFSQNKNFKLSIAVLIFFVIYSTCWFLNHKQCFMFTKVKLRNIS